MKNNSINLAKLKKEINDLEDNKYKEIFNGLILLIEELTDNIEDINIRQDSLEENIKYIDEDIIGLQDELFEEVSIEDLSEIEEEYVEINCIHCKKPLFIESTVFNNNKNIPCPFCHSEALKNK